MLIKSLCPFSSLFGGKGRGEESEPLQGKLVALPISWLRFPPCPLWGSSHRIPGTMTKHNSTFSLRLFGEKKKKKKEKTTRIKRVEGKHRVNTTLRWEWDVHPHPATCPGGEAGWESSHPSIHPSTCPSVLRGLSPARNSVLVAPRDAPGAHWSLQMRRMM